MINSVKFVPASEHEIDGVIELIKKRMEWQDAVGIKHWNTAGYLDIFPRQYFEKAVSEQRLYILKLGNEILAALTIWDENKWWKDDPKKSSYYLHNVVSNQKYKGSGKLILTFCEQKAKQDGKESIRVDVENRNPKLNQVYEEFGYNMVSQVFDFGLLFDKREKTIE